MRRVTVDKTVLLATLKVNRENHRAIFLEAVEGYRKQMLELLDASVERIKAGKFIQDSVYLPIPADHTKDYDRVIGMLMLSLDVTVELEEEDYASYVDDDWEWKMLFLTSNSTYSSTAATLAGR